MILWEKNKSKWKITFKTKTFDQRAQTLASVHIFKKMGSSNLCFDALLGRVHVIIGSLVRLILHPARPPQPPAMYMRKGELRG